MTGYFWGLLAVSVCCAAVEFLTPSGEGGGVAGHVRFMSALCLLCVMVTPLTPLLAEGNLADRIEGAIDDWLDEGERAQEEYGGRWEEQLEEMDAAYAQACLASLLQQKFEIAAEDVAVRVETDGTGETISVVYIRLSGRAVWLNTHAMEAYIEEMLGCECTTYLE